MDIVSQTDRQPHKDRERETDRQRQRQTQRDREVWNGIIREVQTKWSPARVLSLWGYHSHIYIRHFLADA